MDHARACLESRAGHAGVYNEEVFSSLDWILDQASQRGIHLILPIEVQLSIHCLMSPSRTIDVDWLGPHCMHLRSMTQRTVQQGGQTIIQRQPQKPYQPFSNVKRDPHYQQLLPLPTWCLDYT